MVLCSNTPADCAEATSVALCVDSNQWLTSPVSASVSLRTNLFLAAWFKCWAPTGDFQIISTLIEALIWWSQPLSHYVVTETLITHIQSATFKYYICCSWGNMILGEARNINAYRTELVCLYKVDVNRLESHILSVSYFLLSAHSSCWISHPASSVFPPLPAELHGRQQHRYGVPGALRGGIWQRLLGGRQQPRRDWLCHGRRALRAGGERDFQLPPGPRVRTPEPLGHAGAEAQLAAHTQGKLPRARCIDLFWPCLYLAVLYIHQPDSRYILLMTFLLFLSFRHRVIFLFRFNFSVPPSGFLVIC